MYKTYAVMFMNTETRRIGHDTFTSRNKNEALHDFRECYRHGDYKILAVVEIPE